MSAALRIIDANLNRAREALRVIEEYARFALDDPDAARQAKDARHALRAIAAALGPDSLLDARDIAGDVGRQRKTQPELLRQSECDVLRAAFARLTEATRALGEYAKLVSLEAAQAAEAVRYRAYDLEQRIVLRGALRSHFARISLYVIITADLCQHAWTETAAAALRGGAGCLQLREKRLPDAELLRRATELRALSHAAHALLIINDRPDIARLVGADGVHVGQDDLSVRQARSIGGGRLLVGKSTHTPEQFHAALAEEPDYVAIGPMFPTATKPQPHIAGLETLAMLAGSTAIPLVAVGGITAKNAPSVRHAGARCLCVCSAVISVDEPEAAARALVR